jgi:serine/threonine protein kinase
MAPEQADEESKAEIGPVSDIYSLAVISYQMLTGDLSSTGKDMRDAIQTHLATPHPRPFNPNLPDGVLAELLKALDKEPTKRHATASSFVNALEQAAGIQNKPTDAPTWSLNPSVASGRVSTQMGYDKRAQGIPKGHAMISGEATMGETSTRHDMSEETSKRE